MSIRTWGRFAIVSGQFQPQAVRTESTPRVPAPNAADPLSRGRYLVMTSCTECHGERLEGWPLINAPDLAIAAAYSPDDFERLMHEGKGLGDRDLGLMTGVAKARFSLFTHDEVNAIRQYLQAFAEGGAERLP